LGVIVDPEANTVDIVVNSNHHFIFDRSLEPIIGCERGIINDEVAEWTC